MQTLSQEQIIFFKENGYVIVRGLLDPVLMDRARDELWAGAPAELKRNDPDSWVGPFNEESDDPNSLRRGFSWKFRSPGSNAWMLQLLAQNPSVWAIAEQMLGAGTLQEPERARGIYCMMPEGAAPEHPYHCHVDQHPFHLGVVGYIDFVPPNGGGFSVWPGSHKTFYYDFETCYTSDSKEIHRTHRQEVSQQPHVDCHGNAGDVVFWHHRLGHSAGHNRSRQIRQAVLFDFKKQDLAEMQEKTPPEDMWEDWAI